MYILANAPLFPFLLCLYRTLKSFIWNSAIGKESSSFVSDIRSKSILLSIVYVNDPNLFLTELIIRWPSINLLGDWFLISLSPFCINDTISCRRSMKDSQFWSCYIYTGVYTLMFQVIFKRDISIYAIKFPRKLSHLPKCLFSLETKLLANIVFPEFNKSIPSTDNSSESIFLYSTNMKYMF